MSLKSFCQSLFGWHGINKTSRRGARRRVCAGDSTVRSSNVEQLEVRRLLTFFIVNYTGGGNNPFADSTDAATHGGSGTSGDPFQMASFRGAISAANANGIGADTITLPTGTYTLSIANVGVGNNNEDSNATGDLDVNTSLTLNGGGAASTIIQAGTTIANGIDKVFAFNPLGNSNLAFSVDGVTIRHGRNTQPFGSGDFSYTGGGLDYFGFGSGSFSLSNSIVTLNTNVTGYGGGMNIDEAAPTASTVTITNTVFSNNTSLMQGGGLNIFGDNAQVTITGSTFSNNATLGTGGAGAQGGGINVRITNQNDGDGAATPFVNISNSTIMGNQAVGSGGGIDVGGGGNQDVNISNTVISGNSLIVVAGGITNTVGGGFSHANNSARTTTLTNVLISNNTSQGSSTSLGGGLSHTSGNLILRNTTISNNRTNDGGGGVYLTIGPSLTLINSTISNNRSDADNSGGGEGGAILKLAGAGSVTLQNTLVDGNFKGTGATANEISGTVLANFSLIGNTTGATLSGGSANNQNNVSARLVALANNGGSTVGPAGFTAVLQTHALRVGSPALDAGSNALVPGGITTDQRGTGFTRILDAADADAIKTVDIGAVEQHPSIEEITSKVMNENGTLNFSFNVGDNDLVFDSVTATSNNATLLPSANILVSGSGATRTLDITPAANQSGSTMITVTINDTVNGQAVSISHTFMLTVNALPRVNLSVSANAGTEAGVTAITVTATSSSAVVGNKTVDLAVTGTGITAGDYSLSAAQITILNGATFGTVTFTVQNDAVVELLETAILTISNPSAGIALGPTVSQNVAITDNDTATFTIDDVSVNEAAGTLDFTLSLSNPIDVAADVNVSFADVSTDAGDFTHTTQKISFAALNNTNKTVSVPINNDNIVELTETFMASLAIDAGTLLGARSVDVSDTGTGTITDNDAAIGNFVFDDANGDGLQTGDTGRDGVTVNLLNAAGDTQLDTTVTAGGGFYSFIVAPGTYIVEFVAPPGRLFSPQEVPGDDTIDSDANTSTGRTATITVVAGQNQDTVDAGLKVIVPQLNEIDVQNGQTQRSYVRYLDLVFSTNSGLFALIDGGRVRLTRFDLDGNNPAGISLGNASVVGNNIKLDFGVQGIGGSRNSNAGDGYYEISVDTDSNGSFESKKNFFRLLGDVTGDAKVDASDKIQILQANGTASVESDVNGDGLVNVLDTALMSRAVGKKLKDGLFWDD